MFGPPALISDTVNAMLRTGSLLFERQAFLLRAESAFYAPPSTRRHIVQAFLWEQAAREIGLPSCEIEGDLRPSLRDSSLRDAFDRSCRELEALLEAAGIRFA